MTLTRRSFVAVAATALALTGITATPAQAADQRVTVVYSPHQDDETLRLAGYARFAAQRGDRLVLVAVTDGEASGARAKTNLTVGQFKAVRRAEQSAAWSYLTDDGEIVRMALPDGAVRTRKDEITALARELETRYGSANVEHYCACRLDDVHDDHKAVAEAVRDAGVRVVRYSRAPGDNGTGMSYTPSPEYLWGAQRSYDTYREVGHISVPDLFAALRASGFRSIITA